MTAHLSMFPRKTESGFRGAFTLLEMLVVIGIIGILLILTVPAVTGIIQSSRLTAAGDQVLSLFSTAQQIASVEGRPIEVRFIKHQMQGGLYKPHYQTVLLLRNYQPGEYLPDGEQVPQSGSGGGAGQPWSVLAAEPVKLPQSIVISDSATLGASSLMTSTTPKLTYAAGDSAQSQMMVYKGGKMVALTSTNSPFMAEAQATGGEFCSIFIRADGTSLPQLPATGTVPLQWYVTLVDEKTEEQATSFADVHNFYCIQIDPINGHATFYRPE